MDDRSPPDPATSADRRGGRQGFRVLAGIDRRPLPSPEEIAAGPLRPLTLPNLVDYARFLALGAFVALAVDRGQRSAGLALLFAAIAAADYLDGLLARLTGQFSRLGLLLDPLVDRLLALAGAGVCLAYGFLPQPLLLALIVRELVTLVLARIALARGLTLRINWPGRIAVAFVFAALAGALWQESALWVVLLAIGVANSLAATILYVLDGLRRPSSSRGRRRGEKPDPEEASSFG